MRKRSLKYKDLPQTEHIKFIIKMERMSETAYNYVMSSLISELLKHLKQEKLAKSDLGVPKGWSGEIPKIKLDLSGAIDNVISRHLKALEWLFYGRAAGKKATEAAEELKMIDKFLPGILQSTYLHSIDAHREYFETLFGIKSPDLSKDLMSASLKEIKTNSMPFLLKTLNDTALQLKQTLKRLETELNFNNINDAMKEAHNIAHLMSQPDELAEQLDVADKLSSYKVRNELVKVAKKEKHAWNRLTHSQATISSAVGTHESMVEIYGSQDDEVRVALLTTEDERLCEFCDKKSKNPDGSFKLYKMSDFKPAGWNFRLKKAEWQLCIPPSHFNCRCSLVYVPRGFRIDKDGTIWPVKS